MTLVGIRGLGELFQFVFDLLQFKQGFDGGKAIDIRVFQQFTDAMEGLRYGRRKWRAAFLEAVLF
jgi:hypothetical protein